MALEDMNMEERDDQERRLQERSRAGVLGSVVALGLSHARLALTVMGRVPLVMLNSVQTVASQGFSPNEPYQESRLKDATGDFYQESRVGSATSDLRQEFRLRDVARDLNRDMRPSNITVRGSASELMNTVARLHRDYAVVVSNFSETICEALEKSASRNDTEVSSKRQPTDANLMDGHKELDGHQEPEDYETEEVRRLSEVRRPPDVRRPSNMRDPSPVRRPSNIRQPSKFQPVRFQLSQSARKKSERE